jgi:hypothetical protein
MTTQPTNDPIPAFRVQSELLKKPGDSGATRAANGAPAAAQPVELFGMKPPFPDMDWTWTQILAGPLLAAIYFVTQQRPDFAPASILVLLGALLQRLDIEKRKIAAIPITLAALRLIGNLTSTIGLTARTIVNYSGRPAGITLPDSGLTWLPLFFAICLIYMPKHPTATGKIFLATATLMLASGLLPIEGSLGIFATCQYFVFIGVVVGLVMDFTSHPAAQPHPSYPLGAAPVGATR